MSFGVGENFGIGLKVPLTLHGKEDVAEFDAALVAIDTLRRFVKRWEFDPDATHKVAQRITTVWPAVTEQVARAAGIPLGEDASQTILCDLLEQAELLAVALSRVRGVRLKYGVRAGGGTWATGLISRCMWKTPLCFWKTMTCRSTPPQRWKCRCSKPFWRSTTSACPCPRCWW